MIPDIFNSSANEIKTVFGTGLIKKIQRLMEEEYVIQKGLDSIETAKKNTVSGRF